MIQADLKLPFQEQIDFFRSKVDIPTRSWNDLWKEQHAKGFMVAGAARDEILADFREAVDKAITQGTTLEEFRDDFDQIVAKHGWSYHGTRGWRSEIIYDTNIRTSYAAGRYRQMTDPDVLAQRPYWEYGLSSSERKRPLHLSWVGTVLPWDDPWWSAHYPPNGWRCKCRVLPRSAGDLRREGKALSPEAPPSPIDPKTGEPVGIDKGWGYNVGKAAWGEGETKLLQEEKGKWRDLVSWGPEKYGRPERIAVDMPKASPGPTVKPGDMAALREVFRKAVGGDSVFLEDPKGETVNVNQAIVEHVAEPQKRWDGREAYFPLIPELIEDPYEIWINFAQNELSGRVALRRNYIKGVRLGKKSHVAMSAQIENGLVTGLNVQAAAEDSIPSRSRKGRLIYAR
jgi:hypothetical protein